MSQPQLTFLLCLILAMSAMGQIGSGIPNTQSTFGQPFTQGQSSLASWGGLSGMGSFAPQLGGSQQAGFGGFPGQQTGFGGLAGQQSAYGGLLGQNTGFGGLTGQQTGFGGLAGQQTGFGGLAGQQSAYGGLLGQNTGFGGLTGQQSTYGGLLGQNTGFGAGFGQQTVGSTPITTSEVTSGSTVQTSAPGPVPVASDTTTDVSNKCHNIIDSDFMSFSTYCSVLPQTTYALPNFFGHDDKFQVNQLLDSIKPLMDSMCYKNIRMFTCPLLFPPCDGEPILPCAKLCRMIKQSCNAFELSFVDCDRLPENAAFCPALDSLPRSNNNNYNYESARTVEKDYSYAGVTQKSNLISSLPERPRDAYRQSFTTPIRTISKVSQDSWTVGDLSKARLDSSYTRAVPLSPPSSYQSAPLMTQTTSYSSAAPLSPSTSYSSAVPLSPSTSYGSAAPLSPSTSYSSAVPLSPSTSYGSAAPLSPSTSYSSAVPLSPSTSYSSAVPLSPSTSYSSAVPLSPPTSYGSAVPLSASRLRTSSLRLAKTRLTSDSYAAPVPLTPINTYGSAKITTKSNSYSTAAPLSSSIVLGSRSSLTGAHQTGYGLPSGNSYQSFQNIEIPAYNPCLDQVVENPCRIDGASFYPVPQKPECFVQCDMDRMYVKPCPKYLVWNPVHNICDWPSNIAVEVIPTVSAPVSSYGRKKRSSGARFVPFRSTVSNDGSYSQIPTVSFAENSRVLSNIAPAVATLRTTNEGYGSATPITEFKNMNTIRTVGGNYGSAPTAASLLTVPSSRQNVLTRTVPTFHTTTSARTVSNLVSIPKTLPSSGYGGFTKSFVSTPYSTQVIQSAPVDYQSTNVAQAIFEEEVNAFECGPEAPSNPCFKDGPQFFPMTTNPSCYIHCSNGIGYVRPCPRGLTWNVEIDACDWLDMPETVVVPPVPQQPSLISYGSYSGAQQNAYGRKKRSTTERKKRFMPFLPEFLDPIRSKAVIGPNLPGIVPLPGLPGPIGFPGPLYPPFAPPIIPPFLPPFFPPPIGPIPPPILPPPLFPGFGLPPPFLPGVGLPPPIFPGIGLPPPFFPGIGLPAGAVSPILPLLPPFPPNFFGADLLVDGFGKRSGGGFPFGDDFGGGFPGEFFDPVPLHDDHHSNYNGKYDSYSSYDDHNDYGHSNKYNYKKNGNFKSYKSRDYGGSYKKNNYDDYSNNYYRKRRDYGQQMIPGTSFGMMNPMQSFMNDYSSQSIPSNPIPFNSYGQQMQTFSLPLPVQHEPVTQATLQPPVLIPSSPCANQNGKGNIAHPTDPTKYIACLTRTKYEIMDCPAGLIYEADIDQCQDIKRPLSLCERENLCLNGGQCYETGPETFKCTCRGAWTGERCETPVSSCASNPCGDGNECHTLFAADYKQDYVCFCSGSQSYGLSCDRNTVPNPCMTETGERETYYPFAFSAHAYVQCNGESMFVLACASDLMWFQSSKVCSREETFIAAPVLDKPISQDSSYSTGYQTESYSRPTVTSIDKTVDKQQGSRYRSYSPHMTIESSRQFNKLVSRPNLNTDYGSYSSFVPIEPFIDERIEKPRIMELPKTSIANQMPRFMPRLFRTTAWQSNNVLDTKKSSQY